MRLFLSYRRDDTAGRSGRLFDALASRFGHRNVFQDVGSIVPGVDFEQAVRTALADSDATLVVIGPEWITTRSADGRRRLDDPDDFVRREVGEALAAGGRVVPVLVGGASLPSEAQLPAELTPLARRQAVVLHDAAWHDDVRALVRHLEGETAMAEGRRARRWAVASGALVAVVVIAILVATQVGDGGSSSAEPAACPVPDGSWTSLPLVASPSMLDRVDDPEQHVVRYTVSAAHVVARDGAFAVVLRLELANETASVDGTAADDWYYSASEVRRLIVGGVSQGPLACFSMVSGDKELAPGQRAEAHVGYRSAVDPAGAELLLETRSERVLPFSR